MLYTAIKSAILALMFAAAPAALAQEAPPSSEGAPAPAAQQPTGISSSTVEPASHANPFQRFDDLSMKGWDVPFPHIGDTIVQDRGNVRSALADLGIGILPLSVNLFQYDLAGRNHRKGPQIYNGQKLTAPLAVNTLTFSYDMGRMGVKNGQLNLQIAYLNNGFQRVNGPRDLRIEAINYYQSLFHGAVEAKIGYIDNSQEFWGTTVAGSSTSGSLGPQATIPFQLGMSYGGFGTPGINVRFNGPNHLYTKIGIQRSLPPGGASVEKVINNSGLKFAPGNTDVLLMDEVGYNRPSSPGVKSLWIRGGYMYNFTDTLDFRTGKMASNNWAFISAIDHQLTQSNPALPFRGVYVGATFDAAANNRNLYNRYYEGRVYGIGLLQSRPFDLASLIVSYNGFSKYPRVALTPPGFGNYSHTASAIGSYAYRLMSGLYIQPGLGVTIHPTVTPRLRTAVNGYLGITAIF